MLQASQQVDTATTSKEAQNIMNLNLKLQSTAAKMQNKAIDVELQKLEAAQLSEHLRIVQVSSASLGEGFELTIRHTCPTPTSRPKQTQHPSTSPSSVFLPRPISSPQQYLNLTQSLPLYTPIIQLHPL
jgi:hypothetical protein